MTQPENLVIVNCLRHLSWCPSRRGCIASCSECSWITERVRWGGYIPPVNRRRLCNRVLGAPTDRILIAATRIVRFFFLPSLSSQPPSMASQAYNKPDGRFFGLRSWLFFCLFFSTFASWIFFCRGVLLPVAFHRRGSRKTLLPWIYGFTVDRVRSCPWSRLAREWPSKWRRKYPDNFRFFLSSLHTFERPWGEKKHFSLFSDFFHDILTFVWMSSNCSKNPNGGFSFIGPEPRGDYRLTSFIWPGTSFQVN